jgi:hypothetical protein
MHLLFFCRAAATTISQPEGPPAQYVSSIPVGHSHFYVFLTPFPLKISMYFYISIMQEKQQ